MPTRAYFKAPGLKARNRLPSMRVDYIVRLGWFVGLTVVPTLVIPVPIVFPVAVILFTFPIVIPIVPLAFPLVYRLIRLRVGAGFLQDRRNQAVRGVPDGIAALREKLGNACRTGPGNAELCKGQNRNREQFEGNVAFHKLNFKRLFLLLTPFVCNSCRVDVKEILKSDLSYLFRKIICRFLP